MFKLAIRFCMPVFVGASLVISGCGGPKMQGAKYECGVEGQPKLQPDWTMSPPAHAAVGVSQPGLFQGTARKQAVNEGRTEIARKFTAQVKDLVVSAANNQVDKADMSYVASEINAEKMGTVIATMAGKGVLKGVTATKFWISPKSCEAFAYVEFDEDAAKKAIEKPFEDSRLNREYGKEFMESMKDEINDEIPEQFDF